MLRNEALFYLAFSVVTKITHAFTEQNRSLLLLWITFNVPQSLLLPVLLCRVQTDFPESFP